MPLPYRPSPQAAPQGDAKDIIKELCGLTQTAWFGLLGFLAFFAVVILSTTDADFLVPSKQTQIPIVQVLVPTERFFFLAPIIATILYCYLHMLCIKLWSRVRDATDAELAAVASASLIADIALHLRPGTRSRGGEDWGRFGAVAAALLIWAFHPALLVLALRSSQAASKIPWLSPESYPDLSLISTVEAVMILCLCLSLAVGTKSLLAALSIRYRSLADGRLTLTHTAVLVAVLLPLTLAGSWVQARLPVISIDRANLVGVDGDWRFAQERREGFRANWCADRGFDPSAYPSVCGKIPPRTADAASELATLRRLHCLKTWGTRNQVHCDIRFAALDAAFLADWAQLRRAELSRFPQLDLARRQLVDASAEGSKFINARLEGADLTGANLRNADFEGAALLGAKLNGAEAYFVTFDRADLTEADLRSANLTSSAFEATSLIRADLTAASLVDAHLAAADLREADLRGADLTRARLGHTDLTDAVLDGAILDGADLSRTVGLTQRQLLGAVGDGDTILPEPLFPAEPLYVLGCWPDLPTIVEAALADLPAGEHRDRATHRLETRLCGPGEPPRRIPAGRPVPPETPEPDIAGYRENYKADLIAEQAQVDNTNPR